MSYVLIHSSALYEGREVGRPDSPRVLHVWPRNRRGRSLIAARRFAAAEAESLARRSKTGVRVFVHEIPRETEPTR